jgi:hypothetical protein
MTNKSVSGKGHAEQSTLVQMNIKHSYHSFTHINTRENLSHQLSLLSVGLFTCMGSYLILASCLTRKSSSRRTLRH